MYTFDFTRQDYLGQNNFLSDDFRFKAHPLKAIRFNKKKSVKRILTAQLVEGGLKTYCNGHVAQIAGIAKDDLNTALEFMTEANSKPSTYPIDFRTFNWLYYEKQVSKAVRPLKVKLYVTVYDSGAEPVTVINKIKRTSNYDVAELLRPIKLLF